MSAKADVTATPVEFDGDTYLIPPATEWDLDVLEAYEEGQIVATVRSLIGRDAYATFRASHSKVRDLQALFEAIQEALGLGN